MALWKEPTPTSSSPPMRDGLARDPAVPAPTPITPEIARRPRERTEAKESFIASDVSIEGKIEGSGHVRIAGTFKGDVHVQGNLTIDAGARLTGQVRANTVVVGGELHGNIDAASRVELLETGLVAGDVKAGSLTVAAGSRMRGQVEFGWDDKTPKSIAANRMDAVSS